MNTSVIVAGNYINRTAGPVSRRLFSLFVAGWLQCVAFVIVYNNGWFVALWVKFTICLGECIVQRAENLHNTAQYLIVHYEKIKSFIACFVYWQ